MRKACQPIQRRKRQSVNGQPQPQHPPDVVSWVSAHTTVNRTGNEHGGKMCLSSLSSIYGFILYILNFTDIQCSWNLFGLVAYISHQTTSSSGWNYCFCKRIVELTLRAYYLPSVKYYPGAGVSFRLSRLVLVGGVHPNPGYNAKAPTTANSNKPRPRYRFPCKKCEKPVRSS